MHKVVKYINLIILGSIFVVVNIRFYDIVWDYRRFSAVPFEKKNTKPFFDGHRLEGRWISRCPRGWFLHVPKGGTNQQKKSGRVSCRKKVTQIGRWSTAVFKSSDYHSGFIDILVKMRLENSTFVYHNFRSTGDFFFDMAGWLQVSQLTFLKCCVNRHLQRRWMRS